MRSLGQNLRLFRFELLFSQPVLVSTTVSSDTRDQVMIIFRSKKEVEPGIFTKENMLRGSICFQLKVGKKTISGSSTGKEEEEEEKRGEHKGRTRR